MLVCGVVLSDFIWLIYSALMFDTDSDHVGQRQHWKEEVPCMGEWRKRIWDSFSGITRAWNWLQTGHKGTIHLMLTNSYFCFNRRTQQLEIAYLAISNFPWSRTQIILPWAYFSIIIIGCLKPSPIKRFSVSFERTGFNSLYVRKQKNWTEKSRDLYFNFCPFRDDFNSVLNWLLIYNNNSFIEIKEKPFL